MLPEEFLQEMQDLLGDEYEEFIKTYDRKRYHGLEININKGVTRAFLEEKGFCLSEVPWNPYGFYVENREEEFRPGAHAYHHGGLYYLQEPSAMAPVLYLDVKPGMKVLDLCAAPGGKTTQIAMALKGEGLLVANEINGQRAGILSENVERMGIKNALVTNHAPEELVPFFKETFDRILMDAPCSGEGMFVKNDNAADEWSKEHVLLCAKRQKEIFQSAYGMLKPGGKLVYSTCTFAREENEENIAYFLEKYKDLRLVKTKKQSGMSEGISFDPDIAKNTLRLFPHHLKGEGHFLGVLEKEDRPVEEEGKRKPKKKGKQGPSIYYKKSELKEYLDFEKNNLKMSLDGSFVLFGDEVFLLPGHVSLEGLRVKRAGLHLGRMKKNRFEPSHALALAMKKEESVRVCDLKGDDSRVNQYLKGETFQYEGESGWYLICIDGYSLGWGKLVSTTMKNHYPKGLRKMKV